MRQRRYHATLCLALALFATGLAGAILRIFPPETSAFYPSCPFYQWTGLLCPGCGATRALAALAQGHLSEALRWNGLAVAMLAGGAAWLGFAYLQALRQPARQRFVWPSMPSPAIVAVVAAVVLFAVARNL